jgi:hypothetical protein
MKSGLLGRISFALLGREESFFRNCYIDLLVPKFSQPSLGT